MFLPLATLPPIIMTPEGVSATPPTAILDYLERDAGNFNYTDPFGNAMIPVLTDMVNAKTLPLGEKINGYNMIVTYVNGTAVEFTNQTAATFSVFPRAVYPAGRRISSAWKDWSWRSRTWSR